MNDQRPPTTFSGPWWSGKEQEKRQSGSGSQGGGSGSAQVHISYWRIEAPTGVRLGRAPSQPEIRPNLCDLVLVDQA